MTIESITTMIMAMLPTIIAAASTIAGLFKIIAVNRNASEKNTENSAELQQKIEVVLQENIELKRAIRDLTRSIEKVRKDDDKTL